MCHARVANAIKLDAMELINALAKRDLEASTRKIEESTAVNARRDTVGQNPWTAPSIDRSRTTLRIGG